MACPDLDNPDARSPRDSYALIDSGNGRKLERFGDYLVSRPASQAVWEPTLPASEWKRADAVFVREGDTKWTRTGGLPEVWTIRISGITFRISPTDFGHLGVFPEQRPFWSWIQSAIRESGRPARLLNLFAYSGGVTLAAAKAGAGVCHLDASKGMVARARENAAINGLEKAPVRWIVDDVFKFLAREARRGNRYDAIVLDPPTFGRGSQGELFKIQEHLIPLLRQCRGLLSDTPLFLVLSCHTPGYTPTTMEHLLTQALRGLAGPVTAGEMFLSGGEGALALPSGTFARWTPA